MGFPRTPFGTAAAGATEFDRGSWDANANFPALSNNGGGGAIEDFYTVAVAGATSVDGITDWKVGDIIKNVDSVTGKHWIKIDQTEEESVGQSFETLGAAGTTFNTTSMVQRHSLAMTGLTVGQKYDLQWSIEAGPTTVNAQPSVIELGVYLSDDGDDYAASLAGQTLVGRAFYFKVSGSTFSNMRPDLRAGSHKFTATATTQDVSFVGRQIDGEGPALLRQFRNARLHVSPIL